MMAIGMCARRVAMVALLLVTAVAQMAGAAAVVNVTSTNSDGTYGLGAVVNVTVTFDTAVIVDVSGGTPRLLLEAGVSDPYAVYLSGSGTPTLIFRYTVVAGNTSLDLTYTATNALEANGGTIRAAGIDADLTLAGPLAPGSLAANKSIVIDTQKPTVQSVTSAVADAAYPIGSVIPIQVVFSEAIDVTGSPTLSLSTGAVTPVPYSSGSGTTTLIFNYTVASGQSAADLTYPSTSALALTGGTIRDVGLNDAVLTLPGSSSGFSLADLKNIVVDGILPTVSLVQGTSGTYGIGTPVNLQVVFSEAVTVVGTPTLSVATPGASIVNFSSTASLTTLNFPYTAAAGENSPDLNYSSTNSLVLNGAIIRDVAGNNAVLTLPALASGASLAGTSAVVIDTIAPTVAFVRCTPASGIFGVGAPALQIEVVFSKTMAVTGTPTLTLNTGGLTSVAYVGPVLNTTTLRFPYTVAAGDISPDLDYASTSALALSGGTIADTLGNPANLTLPPVAGPLSLAGTSNLIIDTDGSTATVTSITSTTGDGVYGRNSAAIPILVTFSEPVEVSGAPTLILNSGAGVTATYVSGSLTSQLRFSYVIGSSQGANDLNVSSIFLNGGSITNGFGPANLTVPADLAPGSLSANKNIAIETTAPTIMLVTSSVADGAYRAGQLLPISVVFSEPVSLSSTSPGPTLDLQTGGGTPTVLAYTSGTGTTTLVFNYSISPGHTSADLDYFSTAALSYNGSLIRDAATNDASITLPAPGAAGSLGANKNIVVDTAAPVVVVSPASVTSPLLNGTYGVGQIVPIAVAFNEPVLVNGAPRLALSATTPSTFAIYTSGSGTSSLVFTYTVAVGNASADLDYTDRAALGLNGGTITDLAQNPANLTLADPGLAGSLGANKALIINASQPVVTGVSTTSTGTFITGGVIPIVVTFDKAVTVLGGTPKLTLETGASDAVIDYSSGSGTTALTFTYTVAAGHVSPDLDYVSASALANGGATIRDSLGNNAILTLPVPGAAASLGGSSSVVIDAQRPTVASASSPLANGIYSTPTIVPVSLTLSEAVTVVVGGTPPTLKMETGVVDAIATYTGGAGVRSVLTFDYQVVAGDVSADLDYFSSAALALNGSTMKDAAGNDLDASLPTPGAA
nr:hypothetical protein [Planctomycetota bacterium]